VKEVPHTPVRENAKVAVDGKQLRQRFKKDYCIHSQTETELDPGIYICINTHFMF